MPQIIPIRDLKNTSEISQKCHAADEPIFITKNGYGDMVVMSLEKYESIISENIIAAKLTESAIEAKSTTERFDFFETAAEMREKLVEKI